MTSRDTRLNIDVTAADKASATIRGVQAEVKTLEGEHEIAIVTDDKATDELADIRSKLDGLTEEQREIVLRAQATQLTREVANAERALGRLDKYDNDEISIRLEARDNASRRLDAVQAEMRAIDGKTVQVNVEARGADELTGLLDDRLGGGMLGGLGKSAGAVGLLVALLGGAAAGTANLAIETQTVADLTGASTEEASKLITVWKQNGFEVTDLIDILLNMNDQLESTEGLADQLGINLGDGATAVERFSEVVKILQEDIDTAGERSSIMTKLFGEEGVRQVQTVITKVGDLSKTIEDTPPLISEADVEDAREFNQQLVTMQGHLDKLMVSIGQPILSTINGALAGNPADIAKLTVPGAGIATGALEAGSNFLGLPSPNPFGRNVVGRAPVSNTIIVNPPGTPAATANDTRDYDRRNGRR
jgi:hypothetical protein